jgi:hypothetical protein
VSDSDSSNEMAEIDVYWEICSGDDDEEDNGL